EPDTDSTFVYGANAANYNIGRLQSIRSVAGGVEYSETFTYDNKGRLATRGITIPGDSTYTYSYDYSSTTGMLDELTYPTSTPSYRFALQFEYANGILQRIKDANATSTVFWSLEGLNARGQITSDKLGNG